MVIHLPMQHLFAIQGMFSCMCVNSGKGNTMEWHFSKFPTHEDGWVEVGEYSDWNESNSSHYVFRKEFPILTDGEYLDFYELDGKIVPVKLIIKTEDSFSTEAIIEDDGEVVEGCYTTLRTSYTCAPVARLAHNPGCCPFCGQASSNPSKGCEYGC